MRGVVHDLGGFNVVSFVWLYRIVKRVNTSEESSRSIVRSKIIQIQQHRFCLRFALV